MDHLLKSLTMMFEGEMAIVILYVHMVHDTRIGTYTL